MSTKITHSISQTRKKWDSLVLSRSDFWMTWKHHGTPCFHFCFLFRNNGKREQVDENDFRCCYGKFSKMSFQKYLITAMFKFLSQHLRRTSKLAFEKHYTTEGFTNMDQHRCQACTKTFDLLLYACRSLKQTLFLNLI